MTVHDLKVVEWYNSNFVWSNAIKWCWWWNW
jgi:hypothetical protein